jgi:hypothetical protein
MEQHSARASDARACKLSAPLSPAIKNIARQWHDRRPFLAHGSLGAPRSQGGFRLAYARKIEIEMRPAIFYFDLR